MINAIKKLFYKRNDIANKDIYHKLLSLIDLYENNKPFSVDDCAYIYKYIKSLNKGDYINLTLVNQLNKELAFLIFNMIIRYYESKPYSLSFSYSENDNKRTCVIWNLYYEYIHEKAINNKIVEELKEFDDKHSRLSYCKRKRDELAQDITVINFTYDDIKNERDRLFKESNGLTACVDFKSKQLIALVRELSILTYTFDRYDYVIASLQAK